MIKPTNLSLYNERGEKKVSFDVDDKNFAIRTNLPISIQNINDIAKSIDHNTTSIRSLKSDVHEMTQEISRVIKLVEKLTTKIDDSATKVEATYKIVAFLTDRQEPLK
jgi:hypothetical protein